jgi:hypothetical protein
MQSYCSKIGEQLDNERLKKWRDRQRLITVKQEKCAEALQRVESQINVMQRRLIEVTNQLESRMDQHLLPSRWSLSSSWRNSSKISRPIASSEDNSNPFFQTEWVPHDNNNTTIGSPLRRLSKEEAKTDDFTANERMPKCIKESHCVPLSQPTITDDGGDAEEVAKLRTSRCEMDDMLLALQMEKEALLQRSAVLSKAQDLVQYAIDATTTTSSSSSHIKTQQDDRQNAHYHHINQEEEDESHHSLLFQCISSV